MSGFIINPYTFGSFTPDKVSNLTAWYDSADTSTITESSGSVSQWDDKSGNGYNLTQGTGANQPTTGSSTINGLNVLEFDTDFLNNTSLTTSSGKTTTFYVLNITDNNLAHSISDLITTTTGRHFFQPNTSTNILRFSGDNLALVNASYSTWGVDTIFTIETTGSTVSIWANGVLIMDSASLSTTGFNGFRIGTDASVTPYLVGNLAEVFIYDDIVPANKRVLLENYLANKWGITL